MLSRDDIAKVVHTAGRVELGEACLQDLDEVGCRRKVHGDAVAHDGIVALVGQGGKVGRVADVGREGALDSSCLGGDVRLPHSLDVLDGEAAEIATDVLLDARRGRDPEEDHALAAAHLDDPAWLLGEDLADSFVNPLLDGGSLVHLVGERVGIRRPIHRRVVDAVVHLELVGKVELIVDGTPHGCLRLILEPAKHQIVVHLARRAKR